MVIKEIIFDILHICVLPALSFGIPLTTVYTSCALKETHQWHDSKGFMDSKTPEAFDIAQKLIHNHALEWWQKRLIA